jgi:hypothetical protein
MGSWTAMSMQSVRRSHVSSALEAAGTSWDEAAHVAATTTLAAGIRRTGRVGLPIATLRDLVVMPSLPGDMRLDLTGFPGPQHLVGPRGEEAYRSLLGGWQEQASGRRMRIGIQFDDSLRRFVREEADGPVGRALVASRREFSRTVHSLVAAGIDPSGLRPRDAAGQVAVRAWQRAESDIPALGFPRELLWIDFEELELGEIEEARILTQRVQAALTAAFGEAQGRRTVVHHGFYFFTPPQWALFQVLRRMPDVDQVFIVHDDGHNPAFSTWRHYFRAELGMPVPVPAGHAATVTPAAAAFRGVLRGNHEGDLQDVRVLECRSPAELVRLWRSESLAATEENPAPRRYAASAEDVERFVQRLGRSEDLTAPRLSELPVGSFLMSLHSCIAPASEGAPSVNMTTEALLDIVASGYLDVSDPARVKAAVVRRAMPYFSDCRTGDEWVERAELLHRTIRDRVAPLGERTEAQTDMERINTAASNTTRLAPWADLSESETAALANTVRRVIELVEEIASRERVLLKDHLSFVQRRLERALAALPPDEQAVIEAKLRGFGVMLEEEIDVEGLVDVVAMLVGRTADFDDTGDEERPDATSVAQLRGLDVLGLEPLDRDLHLTNLAEDAFPTSGPVVGWPFDLDDLRRSGEQAIEPITVDLLSTRAATAALGDLYLFWLALDGTQPGRKTSFSWISQSDGDRRRLSPIVSLITSPQAASSAVRARAGGLVISSVPSPADLPASTTWPSAAEVDVVEEDVAAGLDDLDPRATASAVACPRRFAIQWAMGPSAAFGPEYLQTMLHGNLANALVRQKLENGFGAVAVANDLWAHLTEGQRRSSREKAVVKSSGRWSADSAWLFTLGGSRTGDKPIDFAYEAAREMEGAEEDEIAPPQSAYLPAGVDDAEVCARCPVQARCAQWREPRR